MWEEVETPLNARRLTLGIELLVLTAVLSAGHHGRSAEPIGTPVTTALLTGFPNAGNTGVPAGTTLRTVPDEVSSGPGWYFDPRGWVEVDRDGAVLSDLYIPYNLDISASDVTVEDVRVINGGPNAFGISLRHTRNVTIEDSTISGIDAAGGRVMAGIKDVYGDSTGTEVLRDDISMFESGVQMEAGVIRDSYIHQSGYIDGDHTNGVTSNGGTTALLTIMHNTILVQQTQTDAIGLFEDFGIQANRMIVNNFLAGGGFTIYGGQNSGGPPATNIVIVGNTISPMYYPHGGYFGYVMNFSQGNGNIWSENTWDISGQPGCPLSVNLTAAAS
jgi:hypothetical protein